MSAATRSGLADVRAALAGETSPAEALEVLHTRGLWPWAPSDARAPRWWCPGCAGHGRLVRTATYAGGPCPACRGDDTTPPSLPALIAVAALGVDALARAEAIVAETWPGARLVWRCESKAWLWQHHERVDLDEVAADCATAFSREAATEQYFGGPGEGAAFVAPHHGDAPAVVAAWPAFAALRGLDMHLLACGAGRVVFGCEGVESEGRREVAA